MKNIARIIALMLLLALPACCMAEESGAYYWYELNEDVITVRLPASADGEWKFSVSEPDLLELITCEFVEAEGEFVASFRSFGKKGGEAAVTLKNTATGTRCGVLAYVLKKGGGIEVDGSYMTTASMLTVRMAADESADGKWSTQLIACPSMLLSEGISESEENEGNPTYTAAYMLMGNPAGASLRVRYTPDGKIKAAKYYKLNI